MRRYIRISKSERSERREREQTERLRQEMRELAFKEIRSAITLAIRDIQKDVAETLRKAEADQSGRFIFRTGTPQTGTITNPKDIGTIGTILSGPVSRFFGQRQRTTSSAGETVESNRSGQENLFYRESRSQREAAISQLSGSGARNL